MMTNSLDSVKIEYIPSEEEIAAACALIRSRWTRHERRRRFVGPHLPDDLPAPWQPPVIDTSAFQLSLSRGMGDLAS